jgi:hypothetical protein
VAYTSEISRINPTCFLFMIDQSGSMKDPLPDGKTKAEYVADKLNITLTEILGRCTKADGVRHYFDVGVIAYGNDQVRPGFGGTLAGEYVYPISTLAECALRLENRVERIVGPGGDTREKRSSFQIWFEPTCAGSTPMRAAFERACRLLQEWCDEHPSSYPPTVLHVSDGNSTDGDPEEMASFLTRLGTDDGECLLYNLHVDKGAGSEIVFPASPDRLPDQYAALLFRISSRFPPHIAERARQRGYTVLPDSRFFMHRVAAAKLIVDFFELGTRAANLR